MSAHSAAVASTIADAKMAGICAGAGGAPKGASWKAFTFTGTSSYDAGGSTLDLSALCPTKVFMVILPGIIRNATTGIVGCAYVPGTNGDPATGKVIMGLGTTIALEQAAAFNASAYTGTGLVFGY